MYPQHIKCTSPGSDGRGDLEVGVVHLVVLDIGGFNQRHGEAMPPQIFLTLKFVVWAKLQNDDVLLQ